MTIVCSSGNDGVEGVAYPSRHPDVIAVGSSDWNDERSFFSQYGADLELAAPGEEIWTLGMFDSYFPVVGTSFSSPIVSGTVALMLDVDPSLTNVEIRRLLHDTADKVGGYDYDWNPLLPGHSRELGYGRVNALEVVLAAREVPIFADGFEAGDTSSWSLVVDGS